MENVRINFCKVKVSSALLESSIEDSKEEHYTRLVSKLNNIEMNTKTYYTFFYKQSILTLAPKIV